MKDEALQQVLVLFLCRMMVAVIVIEELTMSG
jgi:hypothetical protein